MDLQAPSSRLQQLELEHADEGQKIDIKRSDALATDLSNVERGYFFSPQIIGSIAAVSLAVLASYFAFSPAAAIISEINADIGPSENASLFSIIWTICNSISSTTFGRISDKLGRRWCVIGASICGLIGGIVACRAQTMNTLIGANVMLGLSAGVHTCYALIIGEICSHKHKFIGVVLVLVPNVVATGFGAYIAIDLAHNASWRWVYYIFIMMMSASIVLQYVFYRPPNFRQLHGDDRTRWEEVKRIDWVGLFFLVAGLVLFLLGISWGGQPLPWSSSRILGLVISGGITLIVFGLWEGFSNTTNPLVPMRFFKDLRGFVVLCLISSVCGTVYLATAIIWPSQVAVIYSGTITSWQHIAWASTTIAFGVWFGMIFIGPFVGIIKHVRIQFIVLMSICVAFLGGLVSCNPHNFGQSAAFSFLAAMPSGIMEMMAGLLVQMDSNDADLGTVFSIVFLIRSASGSIFTSVFIAILNNKLPAELKKYAIPAALQAGLPQSSLTALTGAITSGNSTLLAQVPGMDTAIEAAVGSGLATAYAAAYAYVYYAAVAVGGVGLIAACCIKNYDPLFNDHISRKIYKSGRNDAPTNDKTQDDSGAVQTLEKSNVEAQENIPKGWTD